MESLKRETPPPPWLKAQVLGTLRARGLVSAPRRRWAVPAGAAAALALFAAGVAVGVGARQRPQAPRDDRPRFMLLLYERKALVPDTIPRVAEYAGWAREQGRQGRLTDGEELADAAQVVTADGRAVPAPDAGVGELVGFFIISAADSEEALRVARTNPHLRYGGTIVIRPIQRS
jgi:hypothetical protein